MSLFQHGEFRLHSGAESSFLVDVDALTDEDLAAVAALVAKRLPPFQAVEGVPERGIRFAEALRPYATGSPNRPFLLADDVLTTGTSMDEYRAARTHPLDDVIGVVLFARGPCPDWVQAVWEMGSWIR